MRTYAMRGHRDKRSNPTNGWLDTKKERNMKTFKLSMVIGTAFLLALAVGFGVNKILSQQLPVTAFQVWTHTDFNGGATTNAEDTYFARRSDGATYLKAQPSGFGTVEFPDRGISIRFSDKTSDISTFGYGRVKLVRDVQDCSKAVPNIIPGDTRKILGFDTVHSKEVQTSNGNQHTHKVWVAPLLNCYPLLEQDIEQGVDGHVLVTITRTATKVVVGDPPNELFNAPQGIEVPPSQFKLDTNLGANLNPGTFKKLDDIYFQQKAVREGKAPGPAAGCDLDAPRGGEARLQRHCGDLGRTALQTARVGSGVPRLAG